MMAERWRPNATQIQSQQLPPKTIKVGSQVASPGVPRSPNDVTREPKL